MEGMLEKMRPQPGRWTGLLFQIAEFHWLRHDSTWLKWRNIHPNAGANPRDPEHTLRPFRSTLRVANQSGIVGCETDHPVVDV